jgi:hypothetical protein
MGPEHWLYTIPLRLRSLFRWLHKEVFATSISKEESVAPRNDANDAVFLSISRDLFR